MSKDGIVSTFTYKGHSHISSVISITETPSGGTALQTAQYTYDSNGNVLADGDSVTLIKDLKVKGSGGVTLKRGTLVRNIRLTGDPDEMLGWLDEQLDKLVILQDRDTGFPRVRIDEDLSLHTHAWPEPVAATRRTRRRGTFQWWRRSQAADSRSCGARSRMGWGSQGTSESSTLSSPRADTA